MISKVPLLLFVFALYCVDVKTLVQKPGLASFLEQFVLQDEKTPEFAKLFQDRNNDKINENSENINDYIGKNDVKNKESKANAENNKNKDEFASENSSDESEVAVKNTQKNHFSDDEINMNSRSNEELKNDDWDSANEEKQLNQKEQIQVQQDEDFEDEKSNDDNNSDNDDEQKFKVKFSNSRHQRQMPFEHFPSSKLHPFPKQPWEHASFGRSLRIGSFRKKNDDEQDDQFTSLLNTINAEEELDEDKISKLRKLYKNENEDFEDPSIMEDLQDYQNDFLKHQHSGKIDPLRKKNPKVGFNPGFNTPKMKVASLTEYVRKAIAKGKPKLQSKVPSHNPPLVVEEVPKCPIVFKLKHVEGFSSLTPFGDSKGFYSDRFYAFTQAKFNELRFSYDVQIKPLGLYTIEDKINIILHDAPVKLHFSLDKEMQTKLLHFEYVNPQVRVEYKGNLLVSTGINFFLNQADPVIKQKLVEIVSRDSKMMLKEFISENK